MNATRPLPFSPRTPLNSFVHCMSSVHTSLPSTQQQNKESTAMRQMVCAQECSGTSSEAEIDSKNLHDLYTSVLKDTDARVRSAQVNTNHSADCTQYKALDEGRIRRGEQHATFDSERLRSPGSSAATVSANNATLARNTVQSGIQLEHQHNAPHAICSSYQVQSSFSRL